MSIKCRIIPVENEHMVSFTWIIRLVCFFACFFTAEVRAFAGDHIQFEKEPVKVSILIEGSSLPMENTMKVSVANGIRARTWRFKYESLDAEPNAKKAELVSTKSGEFLFIHGYTDGANCCWEMLVIDVQKLTFLGTFLPSETPIELVPNANGCEVGAKYWLVQMDKGAGRELFACFEGHRFVRRDRRKTELK